ncbi:hypothetical protein BDZ90DRAFT_88050 [Jaminaea rosea]|uniref:Uncharacterized protein n=1 Tax=Jaminaea rosea TaxID=1569628 RepID=A0A316UI50_9BASI|nr:hypothetical protein BDZ90DRAFT_88050 [Jaminaea rosea]PWN24889.1 hypothetical protein BDZ90DRAFT_88050 [Jaminaea rosea]
MERLRGVLRNTSLALEEEEEAGRDRDSLALQLQGLDLTVAADRARLPRLLTLVRRSFDARAHHVAAAALTEGGSHWLFEPQVEPLHALPYLEQPDGTRACSAAEQVKAVQDYFTDLYSPAGSDVSAAEMDRLASGVSFRCLSEEQRARLTEPFSLEEIERAATSSTSCVPGVDGLPDAVFAALPEESLAPMRDTLNAQLSQNMPHGHPALR